MSDLVIPDPALVLLVGASGAGKSTFAARHFLPTQVVSSDRCRALVSDDEEDQDATRDAFAVLHHLVRRRLHRGRLTVVDATNVHRVGRAYLASLAARNGVPLVAVALDPGEAACLANNAARLGRSVDAEVVRLQRRQLARTLTELPDEGFAAIHVLRSTAEIDATNVTFTRP